MNKKLTLIVLLIVALFSVSVQAHWEGTITVWSAPKSNVPEGEDRFGWIKGKMDEFTEMYPGVDFELVEVPWAEMSDNLSISIAGRSWPDIAPIDENNVVPIQYIQQGVLEPITQYLSQEELDDIVPVAKDAYSFDGEMYGLPEGLAVHSMLLNMDLFEERGVDLPENGRWTWDEFVEKMQALTFDRDGDGIIDVYGFSTYILYGYYEAWPLLMMDGARPLSDDGMLYTFNSPEALSALQKLVDLKFEYGAAPIEMGSADVGGTFQAFAHPDRREIAAEPWSSWAIASLSPGSNFEMNFMVAEYPIGDSGEPITISGVPGYMVFRQQDPAKTEVLVEFVKLLTSKEEQLYAAGNGIWSKIPSYLSVQEQATFDDMPALQKAAEMTQDSIIVPRHPQWSRIETALQAELQLALNGDKTPEQALNDAANIISSYIEIAD